MNEFFRNAIMGDYAMGFSPVHQVQAHWLKSLFPGQPVTLLDIGCGAGVGTKIVSSAVHTNLVVGIDLSETSLQKASFRGVYGVQADFDSSALPIRSESIDVVILDEVIEHVKNTDQVLDESHRVLKPRGILLMSTPNMAAWFNRFALLGGIQPAFSEVSYRRIYGRPGSDVVGHLRLFTKKSLFQMLADFGFEVTHCRGVGFGALPSIIRPLDRFVSRKTSLAGGLVVLAKRR